jgi:hypothetical protein
MESPRPCRVRLSPLGLEAVSFEDKKTYMRNASPSRTGSDLGGLRREVGLETDATVPGTAGSGEMTEVCFSFLGVTGGQVVSHAALVLSHG